jgi:hypothetical protein
MIQYEIFLSLKIHPSITKGLTLPVPAILYQERGRRDSSGTLAGNITLHFKTTLTAPSLPDTGDSPYLFVSENIVPIL